MRVVVTGATGGIGSRTVARLQERGDTVVVLTRDPGVAKGKLGDVEPHRWVPEQEAAPAAALDGAGAVIHLAGESVAQRWTHKATARILASRELGTRNLVRGIEALAPDQRPRVLVSASASGYYGDRGDQELPEAAPPGDDFLSDVCQRWEHEAIRAESLGVRVVRPRTGMVLSADFGALLPQLKAARFGVLGTLGSGKQWVPWVHADDHIGLLLHAIDHPEVTGPINTGAPGVVRQKAFAKAIAHAVHRPALSFTPAPLVRLAAGHAAALVLDSQRMTPAAAAQFGYQFEFAGLTSALDDLIG